jgi:hypothetical protein
MILERRTLRILSIVVAFVTILSMVAFLLIPLLA